jgi:undecaprenyl-diphosphatase
MIPVVIIGLLFKEEIESLFTGNILFVGLMLIVTAALLAFTYYAKEKQKDISFKNSFVIGIAQALAVIPGISRSGATIATGLYLGNKKENVAKFSFLMVLVPIIAANVKDLMDTDFAGNSLVSITPLIVGFVAAFISGLVACKLMLNIVKKGKLIYFALYCLIVGLIAIFFSF